MELPELCAGCGHELVEHNSSPLGNKWGGSCEVEGCECEHSEEPTGTPIKLTCKCGGEAILYLPVDETQSGAPAISKYDAINMSMNSLLEECPNCNSSFDGSNITLVNKDML